MAKPLHRRAPVQAQDFNATTSYVNLGKGPLQAPIAQTTLCLARPDGSGENGFGYFWSRRTNAVNIRPAMWIDHNAGNVRLAFSGGATSNAPSKTSGSNPFVYGSWYLFGATWDGGLTVTGSTTIHLYVCRPGRTSTSPLSSASTGNGSGSAHGGADQDLIIGNRGSALDRTFNGQIGYVARWGRVLSTDELRQAQLYGPQAVPNGLILLYANGRDYANNARIQGYADVPFVDVAPVNGVIVSRKPVGLYEATEVGGGGFQAAWARNSNVILGAAR